MSFQLITIPAAQGVQVIPVGNGADSIWIPPVYEVNGQPGSNLAGAGVWLAINDPTTSRHFFSIGMGVRMIRTREVIEKIYVQSYFQLPIILAAGKGLVIQYINGNGNDSTVVL